MGYIKPNYKFNKNIIKNKVSNNLLETYSNDSNHNLFGGLSESEYMKYRYKLNKHSIKNIVHNNNNNNNNFYNTTGFEDISETQGVLNDLYRGAGKLYGLLSKK